MPPVSLDESQGLQELQTVRKSPKMNPDFEQYLLEQLRAKDREIYRLRVELAKVRPNLDELEYIPCEEQVQ